jgi:hypothetical protein
MSGDESFEDKVKRIADKVNTPPPEPEPVPEETTPEESTTDESSDETPSEPFDYMKWLRENPQFDTLNILGKKPKPKYEFDSTKFLPENYLLGGKKKDKLFPWMPDEEDTKPAFPYIKLPTTEPEKEVKKRDFVDLITGNPNIYLAIRKKDADKSNKYREALCSMVDEEWHELFENDSDYEPGSGTRIMGVSLSPDKKKVLFYTVPKDEPFKPEDGIDSIPRWPDNLQKPYDTYIVNVDGTKLKEIRGPIPIPENDDSVRFYLSAFQPEWIGNDRIRFKSERIYLKKNDDLLFFTSSGKYKIDAIVKEDNEINAINISKSW